MRAWRLIMILVLLVAGVLVGGYWYERPAILTGSGYAAHNACAVTKIGQRSDPSDDLPPDPLSVFLRTKYEDDVVTASAFGVLARKSAWFTPGYGCTVADEQPRFAKPTPVNAEANAIANAPAPPSDALSAAIDRAFGTELSAEDQKALGTRAVVVLKDGQLIAERYAPGFDKGTPQLGWSMTKSVANLLVGRLVQEGKVSLDQDHLRAEWFGDERGEITIRQLLQMTSGLDWDELYGLDSPVTRMLYLQPDMGKYVAEQELLNPPGTYYEYSTGSTNLLCSILAPKNGGADFPRQSLFAPLGLSTAVLEPDAAGTPVCGSYMWATPRDWAAIGQFALDDGVWNGERLLPEGWMRDSTIPIDTSGQPTLGYASGWWANWDFTGNPMKPSLPADAYFAEGHDGQRMIIVPSEGLVVLRMGFTNVSVDDRGIQLAADVIDSLDKQGE